MRVTAERRSGFTHEVRAGEHALVADEPEARGGANEGPTPMQLLAGALASCTAITMEMYADRKGWDLGDLEVCVDFELDERGSSDRFDVALRLSKELSAEQVERLQRIAGRCPVHRALAAESEVTVADHVELV